MQSHNGWGSFVKLVILFERSTVALTLFFVAASALHAADGNATPFSASTRAVEAGPVEDRDAEVLMNAVTRDLDVTVREHQSQAESPRSSGLGLLQSTTRDQDTTTLPGVRDASSEWESISLIPNTQVEAWEAYFSGDGRPRLLAALLRVAPHREHVEGVLAQMGLPRDLMMVAYVESEFVPNAVSPKGATGPWQFMPATAARYGLQSGAWRDERSDYGKSTFAAARYLSDLHGTFDDWLLALAAYDAGEDTVSQAIVKGKSRDFWRLSHMGLLPSETQDYVPKILGAVRAWRKIASGTKSLDPPHEKEPGSSERKAWVYALSTGN